MIEMALAPATLGFVLGVPTGGLILGFIRVIGRRALGRRSAPGEGGPPPMQLVATEVAVAATRGAPTAALPDARARKRGPMPRTVEEHALALARWVTQQRPEGLRGRTVTAVEMIDVYTEMCGELGCEPRGWQPVAVELQRLLGIAKRYGTIDGRRTRVYDIPDLTLDDIIADAAARARRSEVVRRRTPTTLTTGETALAA